MAALHFRGISYLPTGSCQPWRNRRGFALASHPHVLSERRPEKRMTGLSGAVFSPCRRYRYVLWRTWDDQLPRVNLVGLNPSTADELSDDPTMRRCRQFAADWGFGGFIMTNLFAFRATKPDILKSTAEPVGAHNDQWLAIAASEADVVVFAWGVSGSLYERDTAVIGQIGAGAQCIALTKHRHPAHPLYLPSGLPLIPFAR